MLGRVGRTLRRCSSRITLHPRQRDPWQGGASCAVLSWSLANPVLAGEANNIYDEFDITNLEEGRPPWRGIFKVSYTHSALKATIGANYFDTRLSRVTVDPDVFEELDAGATWDAEVSYEARDGLRISFGGENLFDKFPTRTDNFRGIFPYSSSSPWGFNGRYFYTRISARGLGF